MRHVRRWQVQACHRLQPLQPLSPRYLRVCSWIYLLQGVKLVMFSMCLHPNLVSDIMRLFIVSNEPLFEWWWVHVA